MIDRALDYSGGQCFSRDIERDDGHISGGEDVDTTGCHRSVEVTRINNRKRNGSKRNFVKTETSLGIGLKYPVFCVRGDNVETFRRFPIVTPHRADDTAGTLHDNIHKNCGAIRESPSDRTEFTGSLVHCRNRHGSRINVGKAVTAITGGALPILEGRRINDYHQTDARCDAVTSKNLPGNGSPRGGRQPPNGDILDDRCAIFGESSHGAPLGVGCLVHGLQAVGAHHEPIERKSSRSVGCAGLITLISQGSHLHRCLSHRVAGLVSDHAGQAPLGLHEEVQRQSLTMIHNSGGQAAGFAGCGIDGLKLKRPRRIVVLQNVF